VPFPELPSSQFCAGVFNTNVLRILLCDNMAGRLCCGVSGSIAFELGFQLQSRKFGLGPDLPELNYRVSSIVSALSSSSSSSSSSSVALKPEGRDSLECICIGGTVIL